MPPDRFDDVGFRFLEHPEEPEPTRVRRRPGRRTLVGGVTAFALAALAAGASIGAADADTARAPAAKTAAPFVTYDADGTPTVHSGRHCMAGHGQHRYGSDARSTPQY
jgi:hypothetical protein